MKRHYNITQNWLLFARVERNLSRAELASMLEIDVRTYRKYEDYPESMPMKRFILFCNLFDKDINEVIKDKNKELQKA